MAYVGATDIRFVCRDEIVVRQRVAPKEKNVQYRDYFSELRKKPQAVRQIAPELLAELGEPFSALWHMLEASHGGKQAGRIFAQLLGAMVDHGEAAIRDAVHQTLSAPQGDLLALGRWLRHPLPESVEVPESLRHYAVEAARASDFDTLLQGGAP